jgi:hypothetical protein
LKTVNATIRASEPAAALDPALVAGVLWAAVHGIVSLKLVCPKFSVLATIDSGLRHAAG